VTAEVADKPAIGGKIDIDFTNQTVRVGDTLLRISPREYELLYHLVNNEGAVLSNKMLMNEVFPEHAADTRFLEVYIRKLRERLGEDPDNPKMIVSEGGTGYRFVGS